jgi:hypothetical protein
MDLADSSWPLACVRNQLILKNGYGRNANGIQPNLATLLFSYEKNGETADE